EPTDPEDLFDDRLERGDDQRAALRLRLLARDHQDSQSRAADVVDRGEVQDDMIAVGPAAYHRSLERDPEQLGIRVIHAPGGREHDSVAEPRRSYVHGSLRATRPYPAHASPVNENVGHASRIAPRSH